MLIKHMLSLYFKTILQDNGYNDSQINKIYSDIDKNIPFNIQDIKRNYKIVNIIYPRDEREYKEFLDNEELGLRLFDEKIGGFIPKDIKPDDILFSDINQVLYRISENKNEKDGKK